MPVPRHRSITTKTRPSKSVTRRTKPYGQPGPWPCLLRRPRPRPSKQTRPPSCRPQKARPLPFLLQMEASRVQHRPNHARQLEHKQLAANTGLHSIQPAFDHRQARHRVPPSYRLQQVLLHPHVRALATLRAPADSAVSARAHAPRSQEAQKNDAQRILLPKGPSTEAARRRLARRAHGPSSRAPCRGSRNLSRPPCPHQNTDGPLSPRQQHRLRSPRQHRARALAEHLRGHLTCPTYPTHNTPVSSRPI